MVDLHLEKLPRTLTLAGDGRRFCLEYIDERKLPGALIVERATSWLQVVDAVKELAIRGAPALGVAGAAALALWVQEQASNDGDLTGAQAAADFITGARPTAVNLAWGVNRAREALEGCSNVQAAASILYGVVRAMEAEDEACNRMIGEHGASLIPEGARILTHCNAGSLATVFFGTALGVVYAAAALGKVARVYADETRPVGQGARLTAWELACAGIPTTLICDNMAASLMAAGKIDAVVVGADRIAANGDTANKIGTYGVAVLAHEHGVPFYVAAPTSTVDRSYANGRLMPIEQRDSSEVLFEPIKGVDVWNPAFDVTPARYITKIITEEGVFDPSEL